MTGSSSSDVSASPSDNRPSDASPSDASPSHSRPDDATSNAARADEARAKGAHSEDAHWADAVQAAMDAKAKPPGSLGRLEALARRLGAIQQTDAPRVDRLRVCVFAADHGVADEGVSAYPASVTRQMMTVLAEGRAAVHALAGASGVEVETVDVGVDADLPADLPVMHAKVQRGTANLRTGPAMTPEACAAAMEVGREAVRRAVADGVDAVGLGEIGIGNTTAASAVSAALTRASIEAVVGRGTGVDHAGLAQKRAVVRGAIAHARSNGTRDPATVLAHLGGLEMAAIAGAALEAAEQGVAVVADGFISTTAVLAAVRIEPSVRRVVFCAHRSRERGHQIVLDALDADPLLDADLCLGEGTGAALALPLLRAATRVLHDVATLDELADETPNDDSNDSPTDRANGIASDRAHGDSGDTDA